MSASRTRVVLVEDSPTQARAIARILEDGGDISVVATAATAPAAIEQVARLQPDLVTMDLDIPEGGGMLAIDRIMRESPTPILVLSGTFEQAAEPNAVAALAAGAVEAMPKPRQWNGEEAEELRRMVRRVRGVPVIGRRGRPRPPRATVEGARGGQTSAVVGIAASTGGPAALATVLAGLGDCQAPLLVVQHIHPSFTQSFARWLTGACGRPVRVASEGDRLRAGGVYVAPGDCHLRLASRRMLSVGPEPESLHRPSADVLFQSLAQHAGRGAVGVVLTGMGADGAAGLAALRAAGGRVLAQDEASSVVFGMPLAAVRSGATEELLPLERMADAIRDAVAAVPG